jgi:hypothetical protein
MAQVVEHLPNKQETLSCKKEKERKRERGRRKEKGKRKEGKKLP